MSVSINSTTAGIQDTSRMVRLPITQSSGKTAAAIGNSVLTAGYISQEPGKDTYTNRDCLHFINAALGRPFKKIDCFGHDGYTTTQLVNTYLSNLVSVNADVWIIFGWLHNNFANSIGYTQTVQDTVTILQAAGNKPVILFNDGLMPTAAGNTAAINMWQQYTAWLMTTAQRTYPNLIVVPCHEGMVSRDPAVTLTTKSYSMDGTHPTPLAAFYAMLPTAQRILSPLFPPSEAPVLYNNDYNTATYNPLLKGANASGSGSAGDNWWYLAAGASGTGPDCYYAQCSGTGATITCSKVVHPTIGVAWDYGETSRACTKVSMVTTTNTGYFEFGIRDGAIISWSSGGAVGGALQLVKPTTPNGCLYRPLNSGTFITGSDPTGGWSTVLGSTFISNSITYLVIRDFRGGQTQAVMDMYVDQATFAGKCGFELQNRYWISGVSQVGSSAAFYSLPNSIGTTSSFGSVGGHIYLPPRLQVHTQYDRSQVIPTGIDSYTLKLAFYLDTNSRVDITLAHFGAYTI